MRFDVLWQSLLHKKLSLYLMKPGIRKCWKVFVDSFFTVFFTLLPSSTMMAALLLLLHSEVGLWGNQRRPPWVLTPPAGWSWTLSTTQSSQTGWRPWPWLPVAWPLRTASGPGPRGPPAPTGPQTERCPFKRGAVLPDSPPSRPNECPSQMLMWAGQSYRNAPQSWSCISLWPIF